MRLLFDPEHFKFTTKDEVGVCILCGGDAINKVGYYMCQPCMEKWNSLKQKMINMSKNEFKPGEYAKFPNEQIPRILDILRANGHPVWADRDSVYQLHHDIVHCAEDGDMMGYKSSEPECEIELSTHTFLVKALRLEEGMGMYYSTSTENQRKHIIEELKSVGFDIGSAALNGHYKNQGIQLMSEIIGTTGNVRTDVSYLDWCRRLCIEPIQEVVGTGHCGGNPPLIDFDAENIEPVEKTIEIEHRVSSFEVQMAEWERENGYEFDPSKPFEINDEGNWYYNPSAHFVGFNIQKRPVIQIDGEGYFSYNGIRNIPEFNSLMLPVGEWMEVTDSPYGGWVVQMTTSGHLYCPHECRIIFLEGYQFLKGNPISVEINVMKQ